MNCMAYTYYVTLIYPYDWLIQVSQDGFMLRFICVFLDCDMAIQLVLSGEYDDNLEDEDSFIVYWFTSQTMKYVTFYAWTKTYTFFYL